MNELIVIQEVRGFIDSEGTAQLNLEDVSRGLGFTTVATSGNECIRWNTVYSYLVNLGVATSCNGRIGNYQELCPEFIPENIFYRLAMKAKNETAEKFQVKVADEILPSIRKHGMYAIDKLLNDPDLAIKAFTALKEERQKNQLLQTENKLLAQENLKLEPDAEFGKAIGDCSDSILIRDYSKILANAGVQIGQKELFAWLAENKYIYRDKATGDWMPQMRYRQMGLFKLQERPIDTRSDKSIIRFTTKITGKGQKYFYEKLKDSKYSERVS